MPTAFYNDTDPFVARWLRNLIDAGQIMQGVVDTRSIADLTGADVAGFTRVHLFAGIAGWEEALRLAGWPVDVPVWTGSCPCQPFSAAGKRKGTSDERHVWPEFARLVGECRPPVVFGEQVASKDGRDWLAGVRAELEAMGYAVGAADLCAASVGAPHIRQRLWWVGVSHRDGQPWSRVQLQPGQPGHSAPESSGASEGGDRLGNPEGIGRERRPNDPDGRGRQRALGHSGEGSERMADAGRGDSSGRGTAGNVAGATGRTQEKARQRERLRASAGNGGENDRLADANSGRFGERDTGQRGVSEPDTDGAVGGVVLAVKPGLEGQPWHESRRHESRRHESQAARSLAETGSASPWRGAVWLPCADGKARRIEPGIAPLAHGVPNRVGRLRAYGNAIVPQVAAQFIRASVEAMRDVAEGRAAA